jgi:hypothetical protein
MEVVGALASSAQLAAYVVKSAAFLSDLYERLKNAPDRIQQDANHIKRLIEIILHIKETRSLHTTLVFAQLEYTISQAYSLRDLLVKVLGQYTQPSFRRRYWKLLKGKKEKQILLALQSLEREKTGLSLCLTAAQIEFLHDVRGEVRKAESNMPEQGSPKLPREQILSGQTYHLCPVRKLVAALLSTFSDHRCSRLQHQLPQIPSKLRATKHKTWKALIWGWRMRTEVTPSTTRRKKQVFWEVSISMWTNLLLRSRHVRIMEFTHQGPLWRRSESKSRKLKTRAFKIMDLLDLKPSGQEAKKRRTPRLKRNRKLLKR